MVLRPVLTGSAEYTAPAVLVTSTKIVFVVPDGLTSGEYKVYVSRNGQNLLLGRTTFNLLSDIPDKAGMNIKGIRHLATANRWPEWSYRTVRR